MTAIEEAKRELMRAGCLNATDADALVALTIATFGDAKALASLTDG